MLVPGLSMVISSPESSSCVRSTIASAPVESLALSEEAVSVVGSCRGVVSGKRGCQRRGKGKGKGRGGSTAYSGVTGASFPDSAPFPSSSSEFINNAALPEPSAVDGSSNMYTSDNQSTGTESSGVVESVAVESLRYSLLGFINSSGPHAFQQAHRTPALTVAQRQEYEVVLLIDNREIDAKLICSTMYNLQDSLNNNSSYSKRDSRVFSPAINCVVCPLSLGDFLWALRKRQNSTAESVDGVFYVLDTVVERKTATDLAQSIVDGRYLDQKIRMRDMEKVVVDEHVPGNNSSNSNSESSPFYPFAYINKKYYIVEGSQVMHTKNLRCATKTNNFGTRKRFGKGVGNGVVNSNSNNGSGSGGIGSKALRSAMIATQVHFIFAPLARVDFHPLNIIMLTR